MERHRFSQATLMRFYMVLLTLVGWAVVTASSRAESCAILPPPIVAAAWKGDSNEVRRLLDGGASPVSELNEAAEAAAGEGHSDILILLLSRGVDVNRKDHHGISLLQRAAAQGRLATVNVLLARGSDVNARDKSHWAAMDRAVQGGHMEVARFLAAQGAALDVFSAAALGELDLLENLLRKTPSLAHAKQNEAHQIEYEDLYPNRDVGHMTPLHCAAIGGSKEAADVLIARGAQRDAQDAWLATPLHYVALCGNNAIVEVLLAKDSNVCAKDRSGDTPLHLAALRGNDTTVELLLKNGADPNAKNRQEWTPLHYAAMSGRIACGEILLAYHADINAPGAPRDRGGCTPLMMAIGHQRKAMADFLLKHGGKE